MLLVALLRGGDDAIAIDYLHVKGRDARPAVVGDRNERISPSSSSWMILPLAGRLRIFDHNAAAHPGRDAGSRRPPTVVTSERACFSQSFSAGGHHNFGLFPQARSSGRATEAPRRVGGMEVRVLVARRIFLLDGTDASAVTRSRSATASGTG